MLTSKIICTVVSLLCFIICLVIGIIHIVDANKMYAKSKSHAVESFSKKELIKVYAVHASTVTVTFIMYTLNLILLVYAIAVY